MSWINFIVENCCIHLKKLDCNIIFFNDKIYFKTRWFLFWKKRISVNSFGKSRQNYQPFFGFFVLISLKLSKFFSIHSKNAIFKLLVFRATKLQKFCKTSISAKKHHFRLALVEIWKSGMGGIPFLLRQKNSFPLIPDEKTRKYYILSKKSFSPLFQSLALLSSTERLLTSNFHLLLSLYNNSKCLNNISVFDQTFRFSKVIIWSMEYYSRSPWSLSLHHIFSIHYYANVWSHSTMCRKVDRSWFHRNSTYSSFVKFLFCINKNFRVLLEFFK